LPVSSRSCRARLEYRALDQVVRSPWASATLVDEKAAKHVYSREEV
jgi:hypothetical protein